ncbi:MAG: hypothetical protein AB7K52_04150 [Phycisphaerales bacterium]
MLEAAGRIGTRTEGDRRSSRLPEPNRPSCLPSASATGVAREEYVSHPCQGSGPEAGPIQREEPTSMLTHAANPSTDPRIEFEPEEPVRSSPKGPNDEADEFFHAPAEATSGRAVVVGIGVVAATAFLFGLGVIMGMAGGSAPATARTAPAKSPSASAPASASAAPPATAPAARTPSAGRGAQAQVTH